MNSISKLFDFRRAGLVVVAFAMLLATVIPSLAMAAAVTERSIALSSSASGATNTTYKISFNSVTATIGAIIVDFCTTPSIGTVCTAPGGFSATAADSATAGFTDVTGSAHQILVEPSAPLAANTPVSIDVTGITNPTASGVFYARILTYTNTTDSGAYDSTTAVPATNPGTNVRDQGGVAMSVTPKIAINGAVLETLIFCASKDAITANCGGTMGLPDVTLGTNGVLGTALSEGTVHTQISTNAVTGAVVNMKSSAAGCGGLLRAGAADAATGCGIQPVKTTAAAIGTGASLFGVRITGLVNGTGTINRALGYSDTDFFMNYDDDGTEDTGVTSPYGDPVYDTDDAPISNGGADLVFGANIGNDTPAGAYSATMNLIATGKF